jgi:hypothetical protein
MNPITEKLVEEAVANIFSGLQELSIMTDLILEEIVNERKPP